MVHCARLGLWVWTVGASLALVAGAGSAYVATGQAFGGNSHGTAVRQVFSERTESPVGTTEMLAETWVLLDEDDNIVSFFGAYFDADGRLRQAQYRTDAAELVWWAEGRGGGTCVEHAPPSPQGLVGLTPSSWAGGQLAAAGYRRGGTPGDPGLADSTEPPGEVPLSHREFNLVETTVWTAQESKDGAIRDRTLAVAADGTTVGFWSVLTREQAKFGGSNSRVLKVLELFPEESFDSARAKVDFDGFPNCD